MNQRRVFLLLLGIGLYLVTTGLSAWAWGAFAPGVVVPVSPEGLVGEGELLIDPGAPRDQECPINGQLFTKTERDAWEQQRPVLAVIENHIDARPQSGLSQADVVYEAVAEGGITRFMGVFHCGAVARDGKIAPVRSVRIYFVDLAAEYNEPVLVHVGGGNCSRDQESGECTSDRRAWALEELVSLGWRRAGGNDIDTFNIGRPVFYRDASRLGPDKTLAVEHTMVASLFNIWQEAAKRGFTGEMDDGEKWEKGFRQWRFRDDADEVDRGGSTAISFEFWGGYRDYLVKWEYDRGANRYKRFTGGQAQIDLENGEQLTAANVVIQFVEEEGPIDVHKHMLYEVIGEGEGLVFQDGQVVEASWEKPDQLSRTQFFDEKGKEIAFVSGPIWIELVPAGNSVEY